MQGNHRGEKVLKNVNFVMFTSGKFVSFGK